jgi:hypothetical protein
MLQLTQLWLATALTDFAQNWAPNLTKHQFGILLNHQLVTKDGQLTAKGQKAAASEEVQSVVAKIKADKAQQESATRAKAAANKEVYRFNTEQLKTAFGAAVNTNRSFERSLALQILDMPVGGTIQTTHPQGRFSAPACYHDKAQALGAILGMTLAICNDLPRQGKMGYYVKRIK